MAFAILRGQTATAAISITPSGGSLQTWTQVFQNCIVEAELPQTDATTYSTEANGQFIAGIERWTFRMIGLMTQGAAATGPLLPLSSFQNAVISIQYDSGCLLAATANATRGGTNRPAGQLGQINGELVTTGALTVTWNRS